MKKLVLLVAILFIAAVSTANAGITLRPMFGFGIGILGSQANTQDDPSGNFVTGNNVEVDSGGNPTKTTSIFKSGGQGMVPSFDIDIGLSDHFAIYTGLGYTIGVYQMIGKMKNDSAPYEGQATAKGMYLGVRMGIKTRAEFGRFCPYAGLGMLLALAGTSKLYMTADDGPVKEKIEAKAKYSPSLGVTSCLGADIKFNDKIGLFFQITGNFLKLRRKTSKVTHWTRDDVDIIPGLNKEDLETEYTKEGLDDGDSDTPFGMPIVKDSFSAIEIAMGVSISF